MQSKASGFRMDTFTSAPTSLRILNTWCIWDDQQIQIEAVVRFLINFWAHMKIFFILKMKIFFYLQCSQTHHKRSTLCFTHISFWCLFLDPHLNICQSNVGAWLRLVSELGRLPYRNLEPPWVKDNILRYCWHFLQLVNSGLHLVDNELISQAGLFITEGA